MRVLLDCRMADWSGVGRYTTGLTRALAACGGLELIQVVAAGVSAPVAGAETLQAKAHPFTPSGGLELGRIARRVAPDVTHCLHFPTPLPAPHPLVVTIHDLTPFVVPGSMRAFPHGLGYRWWMSRVARRADRVLTDAAFTAAEVTRFFPGLADRITPTALGVDDFALVPVGGLSRALAADGSPYLLSMGNTKPHKDLPTLLHAFETLHRSHPELRLLLVGRDVPGYAASVLGDTPASRAVTFTGRVDDPTLRALYTGAAAFVFPSRYEGFGLPPLEAMASGTPVVCSDAASLPEVVGDAALTFRAGDTPAAARAVERLLTDDALRAALVAAGAKRAALFTWAGTAASTLDVYREVSDRR